MPKAKLPQSGPGIRRTETERLTTGGAPALPGDAAHRVAGDVKALVVSLATSQRKGVVIKRALHDVPKGPSAARPDQQARGLTNSMFPVVCVGGSAGGLDAYVRFLENFPANTGAALVIVNHLRSTVTLLHEILPRHTDMPVELIRDGLELAPNHVYIIPPQRDLHVLGGRFRLEPISKPRGWPDVITVCLRSLAEHWKGQLFAVIVSGFDGDGSEALREVHDVGGVTIAQSPESAGQADMPESAIASGWVDYVLTPECIAAKITSLMRQDIA